MKKNLFYAVALSLGMAMATGCSNEDVLEQVSNQGVVKAVIEQAFESRTSVNDQYQIVWSTGDVIYVPHASGVEALTISGGQGTTSATFPAPQQATLAEGTKAYFTTGDDGSSYNFSSTYTGTETDSPMVGTYTNGAFTFAPLAAMVRVVVDNVSVPSDQTAVLTISSTDKNIAGSASITDGVLGIPADGQSGTAKEVTVTLSGVTAGQSLVFDLPVPVQEYPTGLSAELKVGSETIFSKKTNSFTAEVGVLYEFGVSYMASNDLSGLEDALNNNETVVLTGDEPTVTLTSLSISEETTAILDLNGKTLSISGTSATGRAASTGGILNEGELTIKGGTIEGSGIENVILNTGTLKIENATVKHSWGQYMEYGTLVNYHSALKNEKGVLNLDKVTVTSDVACIYTVGEWPPTGSANLDDLRAAGQDVKTTIENSIIISSANYAHNDGNLHTYAIHAIDNSLTSVSASTIKGEGGIALNCADADLKDVVYAVANCTGNDTYGMYLVAAGKMSWSDGCKLGTVRAQLYDKNGNYYTKYGSFIVNEGTVTNETEGVTTGKMGGKSWSTGAGTVTTADALQSVLTSGGTAVLGADLTLGTGVTLNVPAEKVATVDLNGYDIASTDKDVFKVEGTLTIYGTDESVVEAKGSDVCAVWACGGTVTINGGYYKVGVDSEDNRNDCIYAGYNGDSTPTLGTVIINGGKFEYTGTYSTDAGESGYDIDKDGDMFLLNCANSDEEAHITVNGGTFKNHVPGKEPVGGENEVALGTNKKVYNGSTEVTAAHTGSTDIWYTVKD